MLLTQTLLKAVRLLDALVLFDNQVCWKLVNMNPSCETEVWLGLLWQS